MARIPVASPADLVPARLRDRITTAGRLAADVAALDDAGLGTLPAPAALAPLLPRGGVERGRVYACGGDAPLSLLWTLVAPATRAGSWIVLLDRDHAGLLAARENDVALERTVVGGGGISTDVLMSGTSKVTCTSPRPAKAAVSCSSFMVSVMPKVTSRSPSTSSAKPSSPAMAKLSPTRRGNSPPTCSAREPTGREITVQPAPLGSRTNTVNEVT